ncbi:hypothetical protein H9Q70_011775 [Fusarium xylarioides]|nr:hypothetical protein H9Q70_011775 [Fusarium xylarioides]
MHMFEPCQSSGESPSVVESDSKSTSDNSTAPTVFTGIDVPLHNNKEMLEPDVHELLAEDDYDITDVQYDSLSEDEDCEADQADDWSLDTGGSTLHQPSDGHYSEDTKQMLALFPNPQQLQASGELDLDWALIKVTNSDHCHLNAFYPSGSRSESVSLGKVARSQPQFETPVLIVTSGKVPQKGFLQPGITFLGGISGKTPSSVWTVVLDDGSSLKKGDSGSVVVDATSYDVYGHVIGCNPLGEIYISPYRAILRQIRRLFPEAAISLPESSSTRLCHSVVTTRTDQCAADPDIAPRLPCDKVLSIPRLEREHGFDAFKCHNEVLPSSSETSNVNEIPNENCSVLHVDDKKSSMRFHGIKKGARGRSSESVPTNPTPPSHDTSILVARFREYLRDNLIDGVNGEGKAVPYIPLSALKTYFTKSHFDTIVRSLKVAHPGITTVTADFHTSYLRILSILLYIGYADSVNWFTSNNLQDSDLPLDERYLQHKPSWFNAFSEHQWKFCPIIISPDGNFKRVLPSKAIFPVTYEKSIPGKNEGPDSPRLWQAKVHPGYSHKLEDDLVVFKVYQGTRGHDMYTAETNIYSKLPLGTDSAITRTFTGFSFPESQRSIAVFEHANGGSLIDFFHTKSPPSSSENILLFWKAMLKLIETVAILHGELSRNSSGLVHQDIRPENILVFSKDEKDSFSSIDFKFNGSTLFEPNRPPFPDPKIALKENRNHMYLPPEYPSNLPAMHSTEADIWSLGAVFSDTLVWSISGEIGRQRYRGRRMIELIDHNPCYHDGAQRLRVVDEFHELALLYKKDDDLITAFMSRTILFKMLAPAGERCTAMEITKSFQAEVKRLQLSLPGLPQLSSPGSVVADMSLARVLPEASRTHPISPMLSGSLESTPSRQPSVFGEQNSSSVADNESSEGEATVEVVYGLLKEKERLNISTSPWANSMMLRGIRDVRKNLAKSRTANSSGDLGRDQIFLVDDFSVMEHHRHQLMKTVRVVSYMCKKAAAADKDGMKLFFASEAAKKPRKFKRSSQIEKAIKHAKVVKGACDMGTRLDSVLRVCDNGKPKPINIIILTNGVWEGTSWGSGAEGVVRTISRKCHDLRASGRELSGLSIQFIQFGDDPKGTENLQRVERANSDLASVRHFTDSVPYIMSAGNHTPETPIPKVSLEDLQSILNAELGVISLGT